MSLFNTQGKMYPAILVVEGGHATAYAPDHAPLYLYDISSLAITQAKRMGYTVIYVN